MNYQLGLLTFVLFLFSNFLISQDLMFLQCEDFEVSSNDISDIDSDGDTCEGYFSISNSAFYSNGSCDESAIFWTVTIDLYDDGVSDVEYRSDLPESDDDLDDTNGNGIPDLYIAPTMTNEEQVIDLSDVSGPLSEHSIYWVATDDCGQIATCIEEILYEDRTPPTMLCVDQSTLIFNPFFTEDHIYAADFNYGTYDNCSNEDEILYSFDSLGMSPIMYLDCEDVFNSPVEITVYAIDSNGNYSSCTASLILITDVDCFSGAPVNGTVRNYKNEPIEGALVKLDVGPIELQRETITNANGEYQFNNASFNEQFTLSVQKEDQLIEGVSTLDLVIIVRHILGLQPLESPYLHFAADINADNDIKITDITLMRKIILGVINDVPDSAAWRFFDADHEFLDPNNPLDNPPNSVMEFEHVGYGETYDFIGVKVGDVR